MRTLLVKTRFLKRGHLVTLAIALLFFLVGALLVSSAAAVVTFDWVTVGDIGNTADTRIMDKGPGPDLTTGYGSVGYEYQIAKYHVTNTQYTEFLNEVDPDGDVAEAALNPPFPEPPDTGGIFHPNMSMVPSPSNSVGLAHEGGIDYNAAAAAGSKYTVKPGKANYAANWINWASGARFVNWLSNGQGPGDTENGVYDMSLLTTDTLAEVLLYPDRQEGATVFMPSEDEFYKAAYYDPTLNSGTGGYTEYGVGNSEPVSEGPSGGATSANYAVDAGRPNHASGDLFWQNNFDPLGFDKSIEHATEVGAYSSATSHYALFDVDGLIYQWTDDGRQLAGTREFPVYRGGSWSRNPEFVGASYRNLYSFANVPSYATFGLRIAQAVTLTADFEPDGDVDENDLSTWDLSYGADAGADTDGDGDSDGVDFLLAWQQQFTGDLTPSVSAATNVPEPEGLVLVLAIIAAAAVRRTVGK